jgi:cell division protein FtsL
MNLSLSRAVVALLGVAAFLSALAVIDARHQNRVQFAALQELDAKRDQLNVEWGQLLLEQSTWSTHAYIEQSATQKLGMSMPQRAEIVVVKP